MYTSVKMYLVLDKIQDNEYVSRYGVQIQVGPIKKSPDTACDAQ